MNTRNDAGSAIESKGVSKVYGNLKAVSNLHLSVPAGMIFGLLGPNGAGKSTTVKLLTGMTNLSSGTVSILGKDAARQSVEIKEQIGIVPDGLSLFDSLSIWDHLILIGPLYGLTRAETKQRAEDLLQFLALWEDRHTRISHASYGMSKKTALAMALIHNPRILFLDEPFEGLDPMVSRSVKNLLLDLSRRSGVTVFLTSHLLDVMETFIDGYAIIRAGEIVRQGSIEALRRDNETLDGIYLKEFGAEDERTLAWLA